MDISIPGYTIRRKIYENSFTEVRRAHKDNDRTPVILKILKKKTASSEMIRQFRREYKTIRESDADGVIRALGLKEDSAAWVMILEDSGGESLNIRIKKALFSVAEFLPVAVRITEILGQIHAAGIIHKDINPSNIIRNPESGRISIIDFGLADRHRTVPAGPSPDQAEGTLAYISPEQTGRMNRAADHRTDFYALGMTFYEMLTGQVPFEADDPLKVIHSHIAKSPSPPHAVSPAIPPVLSHIILKLIEKNPEDRYQSAWGIRADLEKCLRHLSATNTIPPFELGSEDLPNRLRLSGKLYGRARKIRQMAGIFRSVRSGTARLLLLSGEAGSGKTALVQAFRKHVTEKGGRFIGGKSDPYRQNIPYSAWIQAFTGLFREMLTRSDDRRAVWKERILKATGDKGRVLTEVIPELERITGPQPDIPGWVRPAPGTASITSSAISSKRLPGRENRWSSFWMTFTGGMRHL